MTDKELIQALRNCGTHPVRCKSCPYNGVKVCVDVMKNDAADRLEALLAENERLKAQLPKWVSVDERLPHFNQPYIVTACDENAPAGEGIWYSTVVVVAEYYNGCWTWYEGETEYDLTGLVTHWQPLPESPSTEGVERMSDREKPNPNCRYGRWDCTPCINCDAYIPTMTNADRIRAMTDEELVDFLWQFNDNSFENVMPVCKNTVECGEKLDSADISTEMCKQCLLDKLQQPCEDSPTVEKG